MACDPRVVANLLDQIAELKAQLAQAQPKDSAGPAAESTDAKDNSGLDDFEVGKRNFDTGGGASIRILADFKSASKVYTNGVSAKNEWRSQAGALTGETINIPDINSGYPKAVRPVQWDGSFPADVENYDRGSGLPDVTARRMKFGVIIPSTNTVVERDFWGMILDNKVEGIGASAFLRS